jgi:hypothetical protein
MLIATIFPSSTTTFNKLKIMSEIAHDNWTRLKLFVAIDHGGHFLLVECTRESMTQQFYITLEIYLTDLSEMLITDILSNLYWEVTFGTKKVWPY